MRYLQNRFFQTEKREKGVVSPQPWPEPSSAQPPIWSLRDRCEPNRLVNYRNKFQVTGKPTQGFKCINGWYCPACEKNIADG